MRKFDGNGDVDRTIYRRLAPGNRAGRLLRQEKEDRHMAVIPAYLKKRGRTLLTAIVLCCAATSCDSVIYDYEGDCSATYRVAFRYDRNMSWSDAFAHEVESVHLYAFDKSGMLVWQQSEYGKALKADDYAMTVDLPAGDYRLVAWCGLENGGAEAESFVVPEARVGETRIEELQCTMNRQHDAAGAYSKEKLHPLFHGLLDVSLPENEDGGEYTCTMDLTKDTNHVRIILQQLSGEPVDEKAFTFRIEEENGRMDYDNKLLPDEMITYWAYDKKSGTAGLGIDDYPEKGRAAKAKSLGQPSSRALTSVSVAIADLSIARLVEGRKTFLTVETDEGETSARIPLTDYALLLKDGHDETMTDQDYLDRQDEYTLTFFLDEDRKWIGTSIIINQWKVVLDQVDFGK